MGLGHPNSRKNVVSTKNEVGKRRNNRYNRAAKNKALDNRQNILKRTKIKKISQHIKSLRDQTHNEGRSKDGNQRCGSTDKAPSTKNVRANHGSALLGIFTGLGILAKGLEVISSGIINTADKSDDNKRNKPKYKYLENVKYKLAYVKIIGNAGDSNVSQNNHRKRAKQTYSHNYYDNGINCLDKSIISGCSLDLLNEMRIVLCAAAAPKTNSTNDHKDRGKNITETAGKDRSHLAYGHKCETNGENKEERSTALGDKNVAQTLLRLGNLNLLFFLRTLVSTVLAEKLVFRNGLITLLAIHGFLLKC